MFIDCSGESIPIILSIHAEDASFKWRQRNNAIHDPHYSLPDVLKLDTSLKLHLEALRISGEDGWKTCRDALSTGWIDEYFTASVLAFESGDESRITEVLEQAAACEDADIFYGIISALGWLAYEKAEPFIQRFLDSPIPEQKHIGIAAAAIHRKAPGDQLYSALQDANQLVLSRALKATAELGHIGHLPLVEASLIHEDEKCRFYAAWASALLGSNNGIPVLKDLATTSKQYGEEAAKIALRKMQMTEALTWQASLGRNIETRRLAVQGAGSLGNPVLMPWIIQQMNTPELARVAGEAFNMITGLDIAFEDLEGEWPEGFDAGPNDDPEDENVERDVDEDLPWPNPELISRWWENNKGKFNSGTRYLAGQPITQDNLRQILATGSQRQRYAAAVELAILQPGHPLFEVRAPGFKTIEKRMENGELTSCL